MTERLDGWGTLMLIGTRRSLLVMLGVLGVQPTFAALDPSSAQERRIRVAFANDKDASAFGAAVLRGLRRAAEARPALELTTFDNQNDASRAIENARTAAAASFDVFVEYNTLLAANTPVGKLMAERGVKVLAVQVPVPGAPLFAIDNAGSGTVSGHALVEAAKQRWPGETPVAVIIGLPEAGPMFKERGEAAKNAILAGYPGVIFDEFSSRLDVGYVRQTTTDILTRHPGRKLLVWAHLDDMALAAVASVRSAGRTADMLVSTTGGSPAAMQELKRRDSPLLGTYSFFPDLWGGKILDLSRRLASGEPVPALSHPDVEAFITAENLAQFETQK